MEGHSLIQPAHVSVQMVTVETPVKVSALHGVQQMSFSPLKIYLNHYESSASTVITCPFATSGMQQVLALYIWCNSRPVLDQSTTESKFVTKFHLICGIPGELL